jgi:hypothetical protein
MRSYNLQTLRTRTALRLLLQATLLCLLLSRASAADVGHYIDPYTGVRIAWLPETDMFPPGWLTPEINAKGEPLPDGEIVRSLRIVRRGMSKYPVKCLMNNLERVYVVGKLSYSGIEAGGTNGIKRVYLSNAGLEAGYTDRFIEESFHHEFSSVFLENHHDLFPETEWLRVNPPGFKYGGDPVQAVKDNKSSLELDPAYLAKGFMCQYGTSDLEDDFNTLVEKMFLGGPEFWDLVGKYPGIRKKTLLTIRFYHSMNPVFTEKYFRGLPDSALALRKRLPPKPDEPEVHMAPSDIDSQPGKKP